MRKRWDGSHHDVLPRGVLLDLQGPRPESPGDFLVPREQRHRKVIVAVASMIMRSSLVIIIGDPSVLINAATPSLSPAAAAAATTHRPPQVPMQAVVAATITCGIYSIRCLKPKLVV